MSDEKTTVLVNGTPFEVLVIERTRESVTFELGRRRYQVQVEEQLPAEISNVSRDTSKLHQRGKPTHSGKNVVVAPIPGIVSALLCKVGDRVEHGAVLLRIEAMKMENNIFSPMRGEIAEICVSVGSEVSDHQTLLVFAAETK